MARLPDGEPAPSHGTLPPAALSTLGRRPLGVYVHVPFCAARCGYCDFNTYVPGEADADLRPAYVEAALREIDLAADVLGAGAPPVATIFLGGGTPTLLPVSDLARLLERVEARLGLASDVEITVEANPESVDPARLRALRRAGATRISLGMQSAVPRVLATLDRRHARGRAAAAAVEAREAGFAHVGLDLIYGTPGETDADWERSLRAVIAAGVDHVSAYALTVEPGTRLAARIRRGELPGPDDDVLARRYALADAHLSAAGLRWYELCNWAAAPAARARHNLGYWRSADWWGVGPGAHSHVGGVRWWNVLAPKAYVNRLEAGRSPAAARERLDAAQRRTERVMLELRLAEGLPPAVLTPAGQAALAREIAAGRLAIRDERAVLTTAGRPLADAVIRALVAADDAIEPSPDASGGMDEPAGPTPRTSPPADERSTAGRRGVAEPAPGDRTRLVAPTA